MTYQPNFSDPRIQRRITQSVGFVCAVFSEQKPRAWSTRDIDRHLGVQSNPLSAWLRSVLLICTHSHWNKDSGKCKEYIRNDTGVSYLRGVLQGTISVAFDQYTKRSLTRPKTSDADASESFVENNDKTQSITTLPLPYCLRSPVSTQSWDNQMVNQWIRREYARDLSSQTFDYKDKSSRLWHPLQNVRSDYRKQILAESGLSHQYDLGSAAPTLIYQYAQQCGMDVYCKAIEQLIVDKDHIRQHISDTADIAVTDSKILINALFCGAKLGRNRDFAISQLLYHDVARIEVLKQDPYVQQLREDIKDCWRYITPTLAPRFNVETGRRVPVNSKQKWALYFQLERSVLDCVRSYLIQTHNAHFLEHDGWTCAEPVNTDELLTHIQQQTGFVLTLAYTQQKGTK